MKIKFTLNMDNLLVNQTHIDRIIISWISNLSQEEISSLSQNWINDQDFLLHKMDGLQKVGESSLTIEPLTSSSKSAGEEVRS
ncbi:MAG: hypothetical protein WBD28_08350 [Candidatus Zixiibacteriota bacterium]